MKSQMKYDKEWTAKPLLLQLSSNKHNAFCTLDVLNVDDKGYDDTDALNCVTSYPQFA